MLRAEVEKHETISRFACDILSRIYQRVSKYRAIIRLIPSQEPPEPLAAQPVFQFRESLFLLHLSEKHILQLLYTQINPSPIFCPYKQLSYR